MRKRSETVRELRKVITELRSQVALTERERDRERSWRLSVQHDFDRLKADPPKIARDKLKQVFDETSLEKYGETWFVVRFPTYKLFDDTLAVPTERDLPTEE